MVMRVYCSHLWLLFWFSCCSVEGIVTRPRPSGSSGVSEDGVREVRGGAFGRDDEPQNGGLSAPTALDRPPSRNVETFVISSADDQLLTDTLLTLSDEESGAGSRKSTDKRDDSEDVEMLDEGFKGTEAGGTDIPPVLTSRIVNKNDMQRKQDGGGFDLTSGRQPFGVNMPVRILEHATVQVNPQSTLVAPPGQVVSLFFDVTNNLNVPVFFTFRAEDQHALIRNVFPPRGWIESMRTQVVTVVMETKVQQTEMDTIIFIAQLGSGAEVAIRKAHFRIGTPVSDTSGPDIDYSYNGDCRDALTPQTCTTAAWGADITVLDSESGLLSVSSFPLGLQYRGEFIAGTRDKVYLHYSASCCDTKVDVVATDLKGNTYKRTINVERQWWTAAEISAVVLGVLLLLIVIALIVAGIVACCRNRGSRDFTR